MSNSVTAQEWVTQNNIRTVRLETISLDGVVSGKYLAAAKFISGAESGWSFCDVVFGVDLGNEPQLGFEYGAWRGEIGDVILKGDFSTLNIDPCIPGQGFITCVLVDRKGQPLPVCSRSTLQRLVDRLAAEGYTARAAVEIEATVFEESIEQARAMDFKGLHPLGGDAGALYVLGRSRKFTQYLDAVSVRLDEMGIPWEGFCDESAAGQVEVNLPPSDPITAADHYTRVKFVMRQVAHEQGHSVTFMAKWSPDEFGQGAHINLSLLKAGRNVFFNEDTPDQPSDIMRHFMGGALETMTAASSFSFPTINSYRRIAELNGPPTTITWGNENKTTAIRAICRDAKQARIEYRIPSADANIYLAFSAFPCRRNPWP